MIEPNSNAMGLKGVVIEECKFESETNRCVPPLAGRFLTDVFIQVHLAFEVGVQSNGDSW